MPAIRPSVLVVEDDPIARRAIVQLLQSLAHVVDVDSGEAALTVLDTGTVFDVVVLDLSPRDAWRRQLFDEVRARHPLMTARFVALTDACADALDDAFREALGERLLVKPIDVAELLALVIAVAGSSDAAA